MSIIVAIFVNVLDLIPIFRAPCILVVSGDKIELEAEMVVCIKKYTKAVKVRNRNISKKGVEWIFEMQTRNESGLVAEIAAMETVTSVHLMTHDGDVRF